MRRLALLSLSAALAACSPEATRDAAPAEFEGEDWIETGPAGPPGPRPDPPRAEGEEDDREEDDEDDEDDEARSGRFWGFFTEVDTEGNIGEVYGEFFVEEEGAEVCLVLFSTTVAEPANACTECSRAWAFTITEPEVEIDDNGGCERYGPPQIEGLTYALGIVGDELFRYEGEAWEPIGEASKDEGELFMEWQLPLEG